MTPNHQLYRLLVLSPDRALSGGHAIAESAAVLGDPLSQRLPLLPMSITLGLPPLDGAIEQAVPWVNRRLFQCDVGRGRSSDWPHAHSLRRLQDNLKIRSSISMQAR